MSDYVPEKTVHRGALLTFFHLKKSATEAHQLLVEAYGNRALGQRTCYEWYEKFKAGNFDLHNEPRGRPPRNFENDELEKLLDEDNTLTQVELARRLGAAQTTVSRRLRALGKIRKLGCWVPHELNETQKNKRLTVCQELLQRFEKKSFLHRIVTSDEKWLLYDNPQRKTSWVNPGEPAGETTRPNRFGKKVLLCVWWDQLGVIYHELLKPSETVTADRYQRQLTNLARALTLKRPETESRHEKVILLHDNAPAHTASGTRDMLATFNWEILPHPPYSPDLAHSDYHLFASLGHAVSNQQFKTFAEAEKWVVDWFASKDEAFYRKGIRKLPERWAECIAHNGSYFE